VKAIVKSSKETHIKNQWGVDRNKKNLAIYEKEIKGQFFLTNKKFNVIFEV
jgi:hypothetical protein